jgi:hypothetical protein
LEVLGLNLNSIFKLNLEICSQIEVLSRIFGFYIQIWWIFWLFWSYRAGQQTITRFKQKIRLVSQGKNSNNRDQLKFCAFSCLRFFVPTFLKLNFMNFEHILKDYGNFKLKFINFFVVLGKIKTSGIRLDSFKFSIQFLVIYRSTFTLPEPKIEFSS